MNQPTVLDNVSPEMSIYGSAHLRGRVMEQLDEQSHHRWWRKSFAPYGAAEADSDLDHSLRSAAMS